MLLITAFSAIIAPFIFIVLLKMPAKKGMLYSAIIVILLAILFWGMAGAVVTASVLQGFHRALNILFILFGAIILLNTLKYTGAVERMNESFQNISADMRVQAVIVAFLFGSLIEGAAGFGTPPVVTGPLLLALGFRPLAAATIALASASVAVSFGAVGTPIVIGLSNIPGADLLFFQEIGVKVSLLNLLVGSLLPLIVVVMLTMLFGKERSLSHILPIVPWTLLIGVVFSMTSAISALLFGPEFVTIIASLFTLGFAILTAKFNFLIPKKSWIDARVEGYEVKANQSDMSLLAAWSPYIIVVLLLLLTRIVTPIKNMILTVGDLSWNNIFAIDGISSNWQLLYSPGAVLILAALATLVIQKRRITCFTRATKDSLDSIKNTSVALLPTLALVQVFSNSGLNLNELVSMPQYIATTLAGSLGSVWIFVAPFLGILGTFITGSATVSSLTFSSVQYNVALDVGLPTDIIVAQQATGAAAGTMICIHSVVAAATVVGLVGKEGEIIRKVLPVALIYGLLVGIAGFIMFLFY